MALKTIYHCSLLTGGAATALDSFDGESLLDKDRAFTIVGDVLYVHELDDDSGAAENSPAIIAPDTNAGDKRWILLGTRYIDAGLTFADLGTGFSLAGGSTSRTLLVPENVTFSDSRATVFPGMDTGAAAPTTGAWVLGSIRWNTAPEAGQAVGWVCTVAGSPGMWVAFGYLTQPITYGTRTEMNGTFSGWDSVPTSGGLAADGFGRKFVFSRYGQTTGDAAKNAAGEWDWIYQIGWNTGALVATKPAFYLSWESDWTDGAGELQGEFYLQYVGPSGARNRRPLGIYMNHATTYTRLDLNGKISIGDGAQNQVWYFGDGMDITSGGSGTLFSNGWGILNLTNNTTFIQQMNAANDDQLDLIFADANDVVQVGDAAATVNARGKLGVNTYLDAAPVTHLEVGGSQSGVVNPVADDYGVAENDYIIMWYPSTISKVLTLPSATGAAAAGQGRHIIIKNMAVSTANVVPTGAETIEGAATYPLAYLEFVHVVNWNGNWHVVGKG